MINGGWDRHVLYLVKAKTLGYFRLYGLQIINANATWMNAGLAYEMHTFNPHRLTAFWSQEQGLAAVRQRWSSCECENTAGKGLAVTSTDDDEAWRVKDVIQHTSSIARPSNTLCPMRACLSGCLLGCWCRPQPLPPQVHRGHG